MKIYNDFVGFYIFMNESSVVPQDSKNIWNITNFNGFDIGHLAINSGSATYQWGYFQQVI